MSTAAVILAAGRSERMARPKALLPFPGAGETFIARIRRLVLEAGVDAVVAVANHETESAIREALPAGALVAVNARPEEGMVSSIRLGLALLPEIPGKLLVTLVDIPEISPVVMSRLLARDLPPAAWMLVPRHADGRGHPLLLMPAVFPELKRPLSRGLKTLMEEAPEKIFEEPMEGGQPWDVDTPAHYQSLRDRNSRRSPPAT